MKIGLAVVLLGAVIPLAWADDQGYDAMKDFIRQEDDRLKDIKLLSLDLEKADLELKKKEIQTKMAGLSGTVTQDKSAPASGGLPDVRVSGIVIKEGIGRAFISVEGKIFYVREGQDIGDKMKITKIADQAVFIQYPDGRTRPLELYGGQGE